MITTFDNANVAQMQSNIGMQVVIKHRENKTVSRAGR